MRKRTLGMTGLSISQLGFGSWPIAGSCGIPGYDASDPETARITIREAVAGGITLFDTADVYGDGAAETLLGEVLEPIRQDVTICTKGGWDLIQNAPNFSPKFLRDRVEASLGRLRTNFIDIYLLHSPPAHLIGIRDLYQPLVHLRERGRIRYIGVSVAHANDALLAIDVPEVEVIQLPYNLLLPDAEWGAFLYNRRGSAGKGLIIREALGNGLITGKYSHPSQFTKHDFRSTLSAEYLTQVQEQLNRLCPYRRQEESMVQFALRFVLDRPQVASVLVGARTPEQLQEALHVGEITPSPAIDGKLAASHRQNHKTLRWP